MENQSRKEKKQTISLWRELTWKLNRCIVSILLQRTKLSMFMNFFSFFNCNQNFLGNSIWVRFFWKAHNIKQWKQWKGFQKDRTWYLAVKIDCFRSGFVSSWIQKAKKLCFDQNIYQEHIKRMIIIQRSCSILLSVCLFVQVYLSSLYSSFAFYWNILSLLFSCLVGRLVLFTFTFCCCRWKCSTMGKWK